MDVPLISVAKTAFPEGCMENLMLESPDILEAVVAPREGNCLSFVVSHTLAMGVPKRCRRSVIQNAIRHARAVFDSAYQNRARRWGIGPRCLAHRSSINDKSREPRGQQPSMRNQGTSSSETTHTVLLESRIIGLLDLTESNLLKENTVIRWPTKSFEALARLARLAAFTKSPFYLPAW